MAINIFGKDQVFSCPKCGNKTFKEKSIFSLMERENKFGKFYSKESKKKEYYCDKCEANITRVLKHKIYE